MELFCKKGTCTHYCFFLFVLRHFRLMYENYRSSYNGRGKQALDVRIHLIINFLWQTMDCLCEIKHWQTLNMSTD